MAEVLRRILRKHEIATREEELAQDVCFQQWWVTHEITYDEMMQKLRQAARENGITV